MGSRGKGAASDDVGILSLSDENRSMCPKRKMMSSVWDLLRLKFLMFPQWGTSGWRSLGGSRALKLWRRSWLEQWHWEHASLIDS